MADNDLSSFVASLLNANVQKDIAAQNPYLQIQQAPDLLSQSVLQLVSKNPQKYSMGEALGLSLVGGLTSGILGGLGQNYQNDVQGKYLDAITGLGSAEDLPTGLMGQAKLQQKLFGLKSLAQQADYAQEIKKAKELATINTQGKLTEAIVSKMLEDPRKAKRAFAENPELFAQVFGSSVQSPTAKKVETAGEKLKLEPPQIEGGLGNELSLQQVYEDALNQTGDEDIAKEVVKQKLTADKEKKDEVNKFLATQYDEIRKSRQSISEFEKAIRDAGETGGLPLVDTGRAARLQLERQGGSAEADKRLSGRTLLTSKGVDAMAQVRKAFPGQVSNFEMALYGSVSPGVNQYKSQNEALLNKTKAAQFAAEASTDFIAEATRQGYSLAESQQMLSQLDKIEPLFKDGDINPARLNWKPGEFDFSILTDPTKFSAKLKAKTAGELAGSEVEQNTANELGAPTATTLDRATNTKGLTMTDAGLAPYGVRTGVTTPLEQIENAYSAGMDKIPYLGALTKRAFPIERVGEALTAGEAFGDTALLGAPKYALAGAESLATGKPFSEALGKSNEQINTFSDANPLSSLAGTAAGIVASPITKLAPVKALYGAKGISGVAGRAAVNTGIGALSAATSSNPQDIEGGAKFGGEISLALDLLGKPAKWVASAAGPVFRRLAGITSQDIRMSAGGFNANVKDVKDAAQRFDKALGTVEAEHGINVLDLAKNDENALSILADKTGMSVDARRDAIDRIISKADAALAGKKVKVFPDAVSAAEKQVGAALADQVSAAGKPLLNKFNKAHPKGATLKELQDQKVSLNKNVWQEGEASPSVLGKNAAIRAFRERIENVIDKLVKDKKLPKEYSGLLKSLNQEEGMLLELRNSIARKIPGAISSDALANLQRATATTPGAGMAGAVGAGRIGEAAGGEAGAKALIASALLSGSKRITRPLSYLLSKGGLSDLLFSPSFAYGLNKLANSGELPEQPLVSMEAPSGGIPDYLKKKEMTNESTKDVESLFAAQDPLTKAMIMQESGKKADAVSSKGAVGLMQLMPGTAKQIAQELGIESYDLKDPATNIKFGTYYRDQLLKQFGSPELALVAYNWGPTRLQNLIDRLGVNDWDVIKKYLPEETQNYVPKILGNIKV
jgi:hypothetical protein